MGGDQQLNPRDIKELPIKKLNFSIFEDKNKHDQLAELVQQILMLNKKCLLTKEPHSRKLLQRQIDATDCQIDQLIYQLYELTEEEIRIVEGYV